MTNRILLGKDGSNYGLKVSKPGQNVLTASTGNLLFDSSGQSGSGRYFITNGPAFINKNNFYSGNAKKRISSIKFNILVICSFIQNN